MDGLVHAAVAFGLPLPSVVEKPTRRFGATEYRAKFDHERWADALIVVADQTLPRQRFASVLFAQQTLSMVLPVVVHHLPTAHQPLPLAIRAPRRGELEVLRPADLVKTLQALRSEWWPDVAIETRGNQLASGGSWRSAITAYAGAIERALLRAQIDLGTLANQFRYALGTALAELPDAVDIGVVHGRLDAAIGVYKDGNLGEIDGWQHAGRGDPIADWGTLLLDDRWAEVSAAAGDQLSVDHLDARLSVGAFWGTLNAIHDDVLPFLHGDPMVRGLVIDRLRFLLERALVASPTPPSMRRALGYRVADSLRSDLSDSDRIRCAAALAMLEGPSHEGAERDAAVLLAPLGRPDPELKMWSEVKRQRCKGGTTVIDKLDKRNHHLAVETPDALRVSMDEALSTILGEPVASPIEVEAPALRVDPIERFKDLLVALWCARRDPLRRSSLIDELEQLWPRIQGKSVEELPDVSESPEMVIYGLALASIPSPSFDVERVLRTLLQGI